MLQKRHVALLFETCLRELHKTIACGRGLHSSVIQPIGPRDYRNIGLAEVSTFACHTQAVNAAGDCRNAVETWTLALLRTFDDAAAHLRYVIFEARWDELRARHASDDAALRASTLLYEQALADLLRVVRATGLPADPVDWSRLEGAIGGMRRSTRDWKSRCAQRWVRRSTQPESAPLGDHAAYETWALTMAAFLQAVAGAPIAAADDERLAWAYGKLAHLEEDADFHAAFVAHAGADTLAAALQASLLRQPRFDLILNAAVRWLADGGGNRAQ